MNSMSGEKLKGTPYTGTLPAVLTGTKAGYLHRYKIYGNTEQTGTPTPENPIVPSECGERTENLFDKNTASTGGYISASGITPSANGVRSAYIPVKPSTSYYISNSISISSFYAGVYYDVDKEPISNISLSATSSTITTPSNAAYIRINTIVTRLDNCMLTLGSTPPTSYEPYGYKLPLTSGSTPVDIYIGESQTTRRIKKSVLTGEENWNNSAGQSLFGVQDFLNNAPFIAGISAYSTHFKYNPVQSGIDRATSNGEFALQQYLSIHFNVFFKMTAFTSTDDFKSWLQQQYANGTPVTIWYVLATEETVTLNKPLRKIGDYADTIDSTQTSAQIPTTANSTTISWGGQGLEPSEFDSIQEWVDIPTYTYTNGEWVEDN